MTTEQKQLTFEELKAKITHPKKLAFLENYPNFETAVKTTEAIGISERTHYDWLRLDNDYSSAFAVLKKDIETELIEKHEKNIDDIAFKEKTPAQSRIFGSLVRLRALAPDRYREKPQQTAVIGDITVRLAVPPYTDNPALPKESAIKVKEAKTELLEGGKDATE